MVERQKRVLVVGAGPAGLAAAVRLLEQAGPQRLEVKVLELGGQLGGKARSWQDSQGCYHDLGIHWVFGFYTELRRLFARAGVAERDVLISGRGQTLFYEPRDGQVHQAITTQSLLQSAWEALNYDGLTAEEKFDLLSFNMLNFTELKLRRDLEYLDDICFSAWTAERDLIPSLYNTSLFRFTRDALFNWPFEISAYICLRSVRNMFRSHKNLLYHFVNGGWSQRIWDPLGRYLRTLGGEIVPYTCVQRIELGDTGVRALHTRPPVASELEGENTDQIPQARRSEQRWEADAVICTVPAECFKALNPGDGGFWGPPAMAAVQRLHSIAPLALFAFYQKTLPIPWRVQVNGIDPPLFNAINLKNIVPEYQQDPRWGTVLHMEGQLTGFEHLDDLQLRDLALSNAARVPGFESLNQEPTRWWLQRDDRPHSRFLLTAPGSLRHRPTVQSPWANLFLAGDWVRGEVDVPCMENAVRTGYQAADGVLDLWGLGG